MGDKRSLKIPIYVVEMSERFSAEDQVERIIEQARRAEARSVSQMTFLRDVSALYLLGLRQLAREIDQLHDPPVREIDRPHDPPEVVSEIVVPPSIEAPAAEPPEFAAQLSELTLQVTKMTVAVENLSNDLKKHSEDLEKRAKDFKKLSKRRRKK